MKAVIAVQILFYNKLNQTIECINSFLPSNQKIYVLNNGSDANQWKKLQANFKDQETVSFMDSGANLGVSGGRNFLIKSTKEPWIFSVDNDIQVQPAASWLQKFESFIESHVGAKIICPVLFNIHDKTWSQQLAIKKDEKIISVETGDFYASNCFPGGASIVHRSIFDEYGLFDERMFVGFEDYEYALRAMFSCKDDLEAFHCKDIELIHNHRFQKSSEDKEAVRQRYNEKKLKESYDSMVMKYDIVFEHDWKWWSQKQVSDMTQSKRVNQLKIFVKRILGK